jgi:hypothetical protein
MLGVRVYELQGDGEDREVGRIVLSDGRIAPSAFTPVLLQILVAPAAGPRSGGRPVKADEDPEAFLDNLRWRYSGAYLRCGAPEEMGDVRLTEECLTALDRARAAMKETGEE